MKRFVNGEEADLSGGSAAITPLPDRLMVRSAAGTASALAIRDGSRVLVSYLGQTYTIEKARRTRGAHSGGSGEMRAPMPGLIVEVLCETGQAVARGQRLLVLEAMKTQQPFLAPFDGVVERVDAGRGDQVVEGQLLVVVAAREAN